MGIWKKLLLLVATLIPSAYVVFFTAPLMSLLLSVLKSPQDIDGDVIVVLFGHLFMMLWLLVLLGGYGALLYRSPSLNPTQKTVWAVVFVVTAPFGMIVFWYFQVWRK